MTKVTTLRTPKGYAVANHFVITNYDSNKKVEKKTFQSFDSIICIVDRHRSKITIGKNYDYSVTTSKYTAQFFNDELGINGVNRTRLRDAIKHGCLCNYSIEYNENLV